MAFCRVIVRTAERSNLCTKENLLLLLSNHSIKIVKLLPTGLNFTIICSNIDETEKVFGDGVISSLNDSGFSPVLPAELKSNRSVVVHRVDLHIHRNTPEAIKQELVRCNPWCSVSEVVKLQSSLKVVFTSSAMAERCISSGISLFFLHIPGHNIVKDKFVTLLTCYCCFDIEKHIASNCPEKSKSPSFQVCSRCAATDHDYKSCPNSDDNLKCYNCEGDHHAMSNSCPKRREALRRKRMNAGSRVFSDAARPPGFSKPGNPLNRTVDIDTVHKSIALMFLATLKEADSPGSFASELNKLYANNNIPTLNLEGFSPPSLSALRGLASGSPSIISQSVPAPAEASAPTRGLPPITETKTPKQSTRSKIAALNIDSGGTPDGSFLTPYAVPDGESAPEPDIWSGYRVYKIHGTKASTNEEILQAWEGGTVSIVRENGAVPDYNTVMELISSNALPKISIMKKNVFKDMVSSPKRFFSN